MSGDGLVAALARAQANFGQISKSHENPHFKSKYADLSDVLVAVRPALNAEGVWLTQPLETDDDGRVRLFTRLEGHGELREACLPVYLDNLTPQQLLSTLTYYRRGMLAAMLGVAAEDDDDGNAAQTAPARPRYSAPLPPTNVSQPDKPIAAMTVQELIAFARENGITVSGSKADMVRTLEPVVRASTGEEPFSLDGERKPPAPETDTPFSPTVAGAGSVRKGTNSAMAAE